MLNFIKSVLILLMLVTISITSSLNIQAATMPAAPAGCFDNASFCSNYEVVRENGQRYIVVRLFGNIDATNYEGPQDLIDRYVDFARWPEYINGSDYLNIIKSVPFTVFKDPNDGLDVNRHYVHYSTKAPFPIYRVYIKEVADYKKLVPNPYEGDAEVALKFYILKERVQIEGEADYLEKPEGIKEKSGELFVKRNKNSNSYYVYSITRSVPGIDLLPSVAAPYIEGSVVAIFKGIFGM
ncbi:MAG: hypothetical protein HQK49_03735 [Oligoflexia bacterium]|nr:hypothetical protein [Oligoflexia bacterium]